MNFKMLIEFLQKNNFCKNIIYKIYRKRYKVTIKKLEPFLKKNESILDIGSGTCHNGELLIEKGYDITLLDVKNLSFVKNIKPIIYDGEIIPFKDNSFDISLLETVLHHTKKPIQIIKQAKRVSKKIIISEDIYNNIFQKYITFFFDSLLNLEFKGHPHNNKTDEEWKKIFKKLNLKLVKSKYYNSFLVFNRVMYYLEK